MSMAIGFAVRGVWVASDQENPGDLVFESGTPSEISAACVNALMVFHTNAILGKTAGFVGILAVAEGHPRSITNTLIEEAQDAVDSQQSQRERIERECGLRVRRE